jgi:hypothetical protein
VIACRPDSLLATLIHPLASGPAAAVFLIRFPPLDDAPLQPVDNVSELVTEQLHVRNKLRMRFGF